MKNYYAWHDVYSKIKPKEQEDVEVIFFGTKDIYTWTARYSTSTLTGEKNFFIDGANLIPLYNEKEDYGVKCWRHIQKVSEEVKKDHADLLHTLDSVGFCIKSLRKLRNMSQTELGEALGYSGHSSVSQLENSYRISLPKAEKLAEYFGTEISYFYPQGDSPSENSQIVEATPPIPYYDHYILPETQEDIIDNMGDVMVCYYYHQAFPDGYRALGDTFGEDKYGKHWEPFFISKESKYVVYGHMWYGFGFMDVMVNKSDMRPFNEREIYEAEHRNFVITNIAGDVQHDYGTQEYQPFISKLGDN